MIFLRVCFFIVAVFLLSGCSVTTEIDIRNNHKNAIYVVANDSEYVLAKINPKETESVIYNYSCLRVRVDQKDIWFSLTQPDPGYYKGGVFVTTLKASYDEKNGLCMYAENMAEFCFSERCE